MIDLNEISIFVKVVEAGSFSGAARLLHLPRATVSRRIAHLEDELRTRLLHRTTRSVGLTDAGLRYFERCRDALAAVDDANDQLVDAQRMPSGTIRISAPADTDGLHLSDFVAGFLRANPRVNAEVILTDERMNLVEARIDVAFRMGQLADSTLVVRKLGESRWIICASPAYLETAGVPLVPADLARHDCIVRGQSTEGATWTLRGPKTTSVVQLKSRLAANTMSFVVEAAVAGLGIAILPGKMAAPHIESGALVQILARYRRPVASVQLVYPTRQNLSTTTKAFISFVAARAVNLFTGDYNVAKKA
jgi:DNA-binding transcriptional LysR family regulator